MTEAVLGKAPIQKYFLLTLKPLFNGTFEGYAIIFLKKSLPDNISRIIGGCSFESGSTLKQ